MNILEKEKKLLSLEKQINDLGDSSTIEKLKNEIASFKETEMSQLSAWDKVLLARHPQRPKACDFIEYLFKDFIELHGDRLFRDDPSIIGGIGTLDGIAFTIIAQQKGSTTEENIIRNFAMPHPEGYRKALRLMKQAEKFHRPIISFIDTPGAYPGIGAEERGQGQAIANNLLEMSQLNVPIITIVIGEGGSGGALAIGVANKMLMLENAIFSILSPEGYASILWKDSNKAPLAAEEMKLTAKDLKDFNIIDEIIKEPIGGAHQEKMTVFEKTKKAIIKAYTELSQLSGPDLSYQRNTKIRSFGFLQRFNYDNLGGFKNDLYKNIRNR
ncbi:MAG: acetyl-CoA carboxylase carboxyltransferase subunit alpha [Acholeplasma sp.]|uniref:Acetyl-coenzyme A carboxylase carboxyl transferase subunit alpha n=1 Tax=Hujiaoplasma nucleasis TaxID=2725268 RepID=A0A7L6N8C1_9MOLU|nr:acetyl-CoA carboxylase carboxyltransferase subunit alpha [Hujiaoplasma nucleasis]MDY0278318.1 acetyl-CoA carboxylase carboxyltransferase subunit alpha [Acholeplasma sp.]QLY40794.1 acetyl-CoA carboxylase carboxyltransferase subunit alpha [Hujiaoplasma nucleasis]